MRKTSLQYINNKKILNYKFYLCKIIWKNYFSDIPKSNILIIYQKEKNIDLWCNSLIINNPNDLPLNYKIKKELIIIHYRNKTVIKKYTGTTFFDYKHVKYYISLLIWSLRNLKKNGKIVIYIG